MSISILCTSNITIQKLESLLSNVEQPVHQLFFHSTALESDLSLLESHLNNLITQHNISYVGYCGSALEKRQISPNSIPDCIAPHGLTEFYTQLHAAPDLIQI